MKQQEIREREGSAIERQREIRARNEKKRRVAMMKNQRPHIPRSVSPEKKKAMSGFRCQTLGGLCSDSFRKVKVFDEGAWLLVNQRFIYGE